MVVGTAIATGGTGTPHAAQAHGQVRQLPPSKHAGSPAKRAVAAGCGCPPQGLSPPRCQSWRAQAGALFSGTLLQTAAAPPSQASPRRELISGGHGQAGAKLRRGWICLPAAPQVPGKEEGPHDTQEEEEEAAALEPSRREKASGLILGRGADAELNSDRVSAYEAQAWCSGSLLLHGGSGGWPGGGWGDSPRG